MREHLYIFVLHHRIRAGVVIGFSLASFMLVGLGVNVLSLVIVGVCCGSVSMGLGEITYLSLTTRYDKSALSGWSSGIGK